MVSDKKIKTSLLFILYSHLNSVSAQAPQNIEFSVLSEIIFNQNIATENAQNSKSTDPNFETPISPQLVVTSGIDPSIQSVAAIASQDHEIPSAIISTQQQIQSQNIFSNANPGSLEDSLRPTQENAPQQIAQVTPSEGAVTLAVPAQAAVPAEVVVTQSQQAAPSSILPQVDQKITVTQVLGDSVDVLPTNVASNTVLKSTMILQSVASAGIAAPVVAGVQKNETLSNISDPSPQASSKDPETPGNRLPSISETILQYNNSINDTLSQQPKKVADKVDNVNADSSETAVLNPGDTIQPAALNATLPAGPNAVTPSVNKVEVPNAQNVTEAITIPLESQILSQNNSTISDGSVKSNDSPTADSSNSNIPAAKLNSTVLNSVSDISTSTPIGYSDASFKENSKIFKTKEDYHVKYLPFAKDNKLKSINNYAGQMDLGETDRELFFWLVKNETNTKNQDQLLLWLNGGPGCSSMYGLFLENGPYAFNSKRQIEMRPYSWTRQVDMLFIDQPFGTGLSVTPESSYVTNYDDSNKYLILFLNKFFSVFPEYKKRKIILAGESDAGSYLINLANSIVVGNSSINSTLATGSNNTLSDIKISSLMIGNGWIDPQSTYESYEPFLSSHGVLDSETASLMRARTQLCTNSYNEAVFSSVRSSVCDGIMSYFMQMKIGEGGKCYNLFNIDLLDKKPTCGKNYPEGTDVLTAYMSRQDVQLALHVKPGKSIKSWDKCNPAVLNNFKFENTIASVAHLPKLLEKIPVLLFDGDKDIMCNTLSHTLMIEKMTWNGEKGYKKANNITEYTGWSLDGKQVGSFNSERNLTHAVLFNASHMAAVESPLAALEMLTVFAKLDDSNVKYLFKKGGTFLGNLVKSNQGSLKSSSDDLITPSKNSFWRSLLVLILVVGFMALAFYILHRKFGDNKPAKSFTQVQTEVDDNGDPVIDYSAAATGSNGYALTHIVTNTDDKSKANKNLKPSKDTESEVLIVSSESGLTDGEFTDTEYDLRDVYLSK
ncbi:Pheromone-processing carboxypeptidase KEX1 [Smittium culicis]|uniref:Pheromone-processing carboxypeptidase KEX1 n=1 Tax=Smittium culicis TaxID=133412 RepID=A0A1R1YG55_9FUNG|nr:Pheromone-processing carboxypeptidase KEX1 [Smittium culicis]